MTATCVVAGNPNLTGLAQHEMSVREPALRQLDHSLVFGWRPGLGVKGAKVYLQTKGIQSNPSRIPRAVHAPERPLPASASDDPTPFHGNLSSSPRNVRLRKLKSETTTRKISATAVHAPTHLTLLKDKSNLRTNSEEGVREGGTVPTRTAGAQGVAVAEKKVLKSVDKTVKQGSEGRQSQLLQKATCRRGNLKGRSCVGGVQKKTAAIGVVRNEKTARAQDGGAKRVQRAVHIKGGTAAGKKAQEREKKTTWTRNRQLFLSHKYSTLWGKKVFGRVFPSRARRHRSLQLQRQTFRVWNQQWWSSRREWKLNIRAECHDRYRLWILVWKNWTEFVYARKQRKTVKATAASHNESRLKRRAWQGWCVYQRRRGEGNISREVARRWYLSRILRWGWVRWRCSLQCKRESDVMLSTALHHWALRLQTQVWVQWMGRYREGVLLREKNAFAERHWVLRQEAGCWSAWVMYAEHRRRRSHMNELAVKRRCSTLLVKHFTLWQHRLQRAKQLAVFQQLVTERGVRAVKRRVLVHWMHYMELVLYGRHQLQVAASHYHTTLKYKAVVCLRGYSERQKLQATCRSAARQFRARKMLQHGWHVWLQRCEHCEEIKMLPLTRKARQHFRHCALKRVFPGWKAFVVLRRHHKVQVTLADQHFKSIALPKCFAALQSYSALQYYKRELHGQAQGFRRENLLSMVFYKWWRAYHFSQDIHMLERVAILHSEEVVKRSTLKLWRARTRHRVQQLNHEHSAVAHHRRRLLSTVLKKWKNRRQRRVVAARHVVCALQHYSHNFTRRVWTSWMKYVEQRRESHARCSFGTGHYHTVLLHRAWRGWKIHHCCAVRKKEKKTLAHQFYSVMLQKCTLRQWWENVQFHQRQHELTKMAVTHFEKTAYLKYFGVWKQRTGQRLEIAQSENERVQQVTTVLRRAKLARVLGSWREYSNSSIARRIGSERAVVHLNRCLLRKCLTGWHEYHQLALKKMLLSKHCAHFERSRLVSTFYAKWRLEFMGAIAMRKKSMLALWHWSQILQRKALTCWLLYAMNRKRKAERYAQALQRYRKRLLQIGVMQWIMFATSMESQRMESALQHRAQITQKTMQCVRRCVCRWRAVAREGRRMHHNMLTKKTLYKIGSASFKAQVPRIQRQISEDIWTSIARKHHISDYPVCGRPQPRQPDYLRSLNKSRDIPLPDSNLAPRPVVPHPLSPPVLYGRQQRQRLGLNSESEALAATHSYTFLPSTCSEQSAEPQTQLTSTEHLCVPYQSACVPYQPASRPSLPTALSKPSARTMKQASRHPATQPHQVLLPPSAFENPPPPPPVAPSQSESCRVSRVSVESGTVEPVTSVTTGVASLNDPAVRSHIVHVRNELRKYHEMRTKQKMLEEQVASAGENGSGQLASAELQAELSRTVETLQRTEPLILDMVSQVRGLISENQD